MSEGINGSLPPEYRLVRAAKILQCTPWELEARGPFDKWADWALICEKADNLVENALVKRAGKGHRSDD